MFRIVKRIVLNICVGVAIAGLTKAEAQQTLSAGVPPAASPGDTRYGLFNGLDRRSAYGVGVFPEPFLVDDSDLEPNEFRLDWLHTRGPGQHSDSGKAEIEKGFGQLTIELEVPYEYTVTDGDT